MKKIISQILLVTTFLVVIFTPLPAHSSERSENEVIEWAVKKMAAWSPPGKTYEPAALETEENALDRYRSIVHDVITVTFDPSELPLFSGPYGRLKTTALILSVAHSESGYRKDVDFGLGPHGKGDGGRSWCLMQVQLGAASGGKTPLRALVDQPSFAYAKDKTSGFGGEDLVKDRSACFRVALHVMRSSFSACSGLPIIDRLSSYASGSCSNGREASRSRVGKAIRWLSASPPPMKDADLQDILFPSASETEAISDGLSLN